MTDRGRFEAWALQEMGWDEDDLMRDRWGYVDPHTRRTEEIWKSARKWALQEALHGCRELLAVSGRQARDGDPFEIGREGGHTECINVICALANPEGEQG